MFDLFFGGHRYSFAATGIKVKEKTFSSRYEAEHYMYDLVEKYGLKQKSVWEDSHDKTYNFYNNISFYIQRVR